MRAVARPLAPGELDYELIFLCASLGGFAAAAAWFLLKLPWPICLFHAVTGHPCLTCGATRSAIALFHGQFLAAWKWNPLAFATYCTMSIFDVYALSVVVSRGRRLRFVLAPGEKFFLRISVGALLLANWTYVLITNPSV
ncbi:MAG: hypothetical protein QOG48_1269 [Verrucomicrobiota bacterium]|jgi:hypothetical protein